MSSMSPITTLFASAWTAIDQREAQSAAATTRVLLFKTILGPLPLGLTAGDQSRQRPHKCFASIPRRTLHLIERIRLHMWLGSPHLSRSWRPSQMDPLPTFAPRVPRLPEPVGVRPPCGLFLGLFSHSQPPGLNSAGLEATRVAAGQSRAGSHRINRATDRSRPRSWSGFSSSIGDVGLLPSLAKIDETINPAVVPPNNVASIPTWSNSLRRLAIKPSRACPGTREVASLHLCAMSASHAATSGS